jgi:hypothetical protein
MLSLNLSVYRLILNNLEEERYKSTAAEEELRSRTQDRMRKEVIWENRR